VDPVTAAAALATIASAGTAGYAVYRTRQALATVTELRHELAAERHAASHDCLTGLPNRRAFFRLGAAILADQPGAGLYAVVVDLDNFKEINDRYGHAAGDEVLVAVAQRFSAYAHGRIVARLGGDEFAGLVTGPADDERWARCATRRLVELISTPMCVGGRLVTVTASVGLAPVPPGCPLPDALRRADAAMYQFKSHSRRATRRHPSRPRDPDAIGAPATARRRTAPHQPAPPTFFRQLVDTTQRTDTGGP
jgi:diguanylate cyclase (GGDEF)-like protein